MAISECVEIQIHHMVYDQSPRLVWFNTDIKFDVRNHSVTAKREIFLRSGNANEISKMVLIEIDMYCNESTWFTFCLP